jgi:hypothetical protein
MRKRFPPPPVPPAEVPDLVEVSKAKNVRRAKRQLVEDMLVNHATDRQIQRGLVQQFAAFGATSMATTRKIIQRVYADWAIKDEGAREQLRDRLVRSAEDACARLSQKALELAGQPGSTGEVVKLYAERRHQQEFIARVTGLVEVGDNVVVNVSSTTNNLHLNQALVAAVVALSPEQKAAMLQQQADDERAAAAYRAQQSAVTVHAEGNAE